MYPWDRYGAYESGSPGKTWENFVRSFRSVLSVPGLSNAPPLSSLLHFLSRILEQKFSDYDLFAFVTSPGLHCSRFVVPCYF